MILINLNLRFESSSISYKFMLYLLCKTNKGSLSTMPSGFDETMGVLNVCHK